MPQQPGGQPCLFQGVEGSGEGVVVEVKEQQVRLGGLRIQDHRRDFLPTEPSRGRQGAASR